MAKQSFFAGLQILRRGAAGPLAVVLALGGTGAAQAQTVTPTVVAPTPERPLPADAVYYVDGQPATSTALSAMNPAAISSVDVLKGKAAQALTGKAASDKVILVTTKANENSPAVAKFNKQHRLKLLPGTPSQTAAMTAARAYIEQTYPNAKLETLFEDKNVPGHYVARFKEGAQTLQLHFDGQGHPIAE